MSQSPVFNTCDVCRHWDNDGMSPYGVCRKNPPTGSGWPRVTRKDWCGEWDTWVALPGNPLPLQESVEGISEKRRPGRPRKVEA